MIPSSPRKRPRFPYDVSRNQGSDTRSLGNTFEISSRSFELDTYAIYIDTLSLASRETEQRRAVMLRQFAVSKINTEITDAGRGVWWRQ
ncbi:hypothetical protein BJ165DRAFT_1448865 [Panaeolus papilionaceus]|nr:hypothetical protein BJ165DRAFT_1448865 [Panaeolus papilionaceus]